MSLFVPFLFHLSLTFCLRRTSRPAIQRLRRLCHRDVESCHLKSCIAALCWVHTVQTYVGREAAISMQAEWDTADTDQSSNSQPLPMQYSNISDSLLFIYSFFMWKDCSICPGNDWNGPLKLSSDVSVQGYSVWRCPTFCSWISLRRAAVPLAHMQMHSVIHDNKCKGWCLHILKWRPVKAIWNPSDCQMCSFPFAAYATALCFIVLCVVCVFQLCVATQGLSAFLPAAH